MFHFFKKKTHKKLEINLHNNSMIINGTSLAFPLSLKDIEVVLGKPDRVVKKENKFIKYIYDKAGIVFEHYFSINNHLKKCKTYIDEDHLISTVFLYYGDVVKSMTGEKELPKQPCQAVVLSDGKSPYFFSDRHRVGDFNLILWTPYGTNFKGITETITDTLSISYFPEIKREPESYKLKTTDEEVLHFDNITFKLAIIQVLMYDLEVLKPIYDLMNDIFDNKAKWHWCNKSWDILSKEIEHSEDKDFLDMIHEEYLNNQNSKVTIYIGDMFYYHQTSSKKLPLIKSKSYPEYCKKMLELHIESLIEANKNIKFVYINNSQVSQWLCDSDIKIFSVFGDRDIPVFFGGMVSGGRMDLFSKKRLVHEIKKYLNKLESKIEK